MKAIIEINKYGTIEVELDREHAPITVDNFVKLADKGFYKGLTFHRVIKAYHIEGFPTKVVIDPKGKIVKVVVGEDPAFYTYLDDLFAK